jgi:hypothetical protein
MAWLAELLLFLLPFAIYALWRRLNPGIEPGPRLLIAGALGLVFALAAALWYGFSRSMDASERYVPPHFENGHLVPGHAEPRPVR